MLTKSYKLTDETAAKLESVIDEMRKAEPSVSWEDCFSSLAQAYETQKAAQGADRQADARDFKTTINRAVDMYIAALAAIPAAQDQARAESEKKINASQAATNTLSAKIEELEQKLEEYEIIKAQATRADELKHEIELLSKKHADEIEILKREHAAELREAIAEEREKYVEQLASKFQN